jgi:NitT/TauT family transport system substrate-binding protein
MMRVMMSTLAAGLVLAAAQAGPAAAEDTLKLAIGQRGNWENAAPHLGQEAGIFKKHGLKLDILYTNGGGETQQAVISGSVDVGVGVGLGGVMGAFAKGAPVRVIANSTTGANDLYWYVPANSPIKSLKDANDKTIAYSTRGSSTNLIALGLIRTFGVDAKPVATGNPASTYTQTMSGQVDIGWGNPPFGIEPMEQGKIRIVARGSDVPSIRDQTVRVQITNANDLDTKKDAIRRYVEAYAETLDWMYSNPDALKAYAEWVKLPLNIVTRARNEFYPKENLVVNRLSGLDAVMKDAVELKFLPAPLTKAQTDEVLQYQVH